VALISYGTRLQDCLKAAQIIEQSHPLTVTVADARFAKPLDVDLVTQLAQHHPILLTVEEGSVGGFGSHVMHSLAHGGLLDGELIFRPMTLPDVFQDHDTQEKQLIEAKLSVVNIVDQVLRVSQGLLATRKKLA
jgi:1-deoxy-D-xylulose-5-phosphate synthase